MNAHRNWYVADNSLGNSLEKLSSGLRINRASDDAGGLAISEALRAQVRGLAAAARNAQDGISLVDTIDSVLGVVGEMLQRGRELAVQAANGTITGTQRTAIGLEVGQLVAEINRIETSTSFNGVNVFTLNNVNNIDLQVHPDQRVPADLIRLEVKPLNSVLAGAMADLSFMEASVSASQFGAQFVITAMDDAISNLSLFRAEYGAERNKLEYIVQSLQSQRENVAGAESRIRDVDMAAEMTRLTRSQILTQSATAMLGQANLRPQSVLSLLQ